MAVAAWGLIFLLFAPSPGSASTQQHRVQAIRTRINTVMTSAGLGSVVLGTCGTVLPFPDNGKVVVAWDLVILTDNSTNSGATERVVLTEFKVAPECQ